MSIRARVPGSGTEARRKPRSYQFVFGGITIPTDVLTIAVALWTHEPPRMTRFSGGPVTIRSVHSQKLPFCVHSIMVEGIGVVAGGHGVEEFGVLCCSDLVLADAVGVVHGTVPLRRGISSVLDDTREAACIAGPPDAAALGAGGHLPDLSRRAITCYGKPKDAKGHDGCQRPALPRPAQAGHGRPLVRLSQTRRETPSPASRALRKRPPYRGPRRFVYTTGRQSRYYTSGCRH